MMKLFALLLVLISDTFWCFDDSVVNDVSGAIHFPNSKEASDSVNNIAGELPRDYNNGYKAFTIPRPRVCVASKREIYSSLIRNSNRNFILAYQKHMPRECNFSAEVVKIVEAYRNAANYVVIFLNRDGATDEQFTEVVKLYDSQVNKLNEAIRKMVVTNRLTNVCYNSLMLMKQAVTVTGEGLVAGAIITYNTKCPSHDQNNFTHRPIEFVSNFV